MCDPRIRFNGYNGSRVVLNSAFWGKSWKVSCPGCSSPQDHRPPFVLTISFIHLLIHNGNLHLCWGITLSSSWHSEVLFLTLLSLILVFAWVPFSQVLGTFYDLLLNGAHLDMINEIRVFQGRDLGVDTESNRKWRVKLNSRMSRWVPYYLHLNIRMRTMVFFISFFCFLYQTIAGKEYRKQRERARGGSFEIFRFYTPIWILLLRSRLDTQTWKPMPDI